MTRIVNAFGALALDATLQELIQAQQATTTALGQLVAASANKLSEGGNVAVANLPSDYPDATALSKLNEIQSSLAAITVALGQLFKENQSVQVSNFPTEYNSPNTVSAIGSVTSAVNANTAEVTSSKQELSAIKTNCAKDSTLLAVSSKLDGLFKAGQSVGVNNHPTNYPDADSLTKLEAIRAILSGTLSVNPSLPANAVKATYLTALHDAVVNQMQENKTLTDTMLYLIESMRNSAPSSDMWDRMRVIIEGGSVGIASNAILPNLNAIGGGWRLADGLPLMGYNTPALQLITNQVTVTP